MTETSESTDTLFAGTDPVVPATYYRVLDVLEGFGPVGVEPKKTSIHLTHGVGFAGIHPRKRFLYLNLRTDAPLQSPRVARQEQVSRNRFHNEIKLTSPEEVDEEVISWLEQAYRLG